MDIIQRSLIVQTNIYSNINLNLMENNILENHSQTSNVINKIKSQISIIQGPAKTGWLAHQHANTSEAFISKVTIIKSIV